ncbi:MAG: hypothetical protein JO000_10765 [Alphaproteobacteria bacterium]|nr:hypothetical protein [Alphaproteobacteria bacterium]
MLFQMIVGAWPLDLDIDDAGGRRAFADRLVQWQEKALREAKLATDWVVPNQRYEAAARALVEALIADNEEPALLGEIAAFAARIAPAGAVNGLAQTLLKLTAPGVPDLYQGTELWDFSLVDPDNRRPVDFARRVALLSGGSHEDFGALAATWHDGRIKQALIARTLAVRARKADLFTSGAYQPLAIAGEHAARVIGFTRRIESSLVVTIVPRTAARLLRAGSIRFESATFVNTSFALQHDLPLLEVFTGNALDATNAPTSLANVLDRLPFALLVAPDLVP